MANNTTNNNGNFPEFEEKRERKQQELIVTTVEATIKKVPELKDIEGFKPNNGKLWVTRVEVNPINNVDSFFAYIKTIEKPDVEIGDVVVLNVSSRDYTLRLSKEEC